MGNRALQSLAIIAVFTLFGLSLAQVAGGDAWLLSGGAAVIAVVAIGIASLFQRQTASFEQTTPSRKLLGLRIGVIGGACAFCGWMIAVFLWHRIGYYVVVCGILGGLIGISIHFYYMFFGH